jgi:hypothetical protein
MKFGQYEINTADRGLEQGAEKRYLDLSNMMSGVDCVLK